MAVPSAEKVVIAYLRTVDAVQDAGARVTTSTPSNQGAPWVRVSLLDDSATDGGVADHHIEAFMQIDVFAGKTTNTVAAVDDLSIKIREALSVMNTVSHPDAVVTGTRCSRTHMPDTDQEPAMERYQLSLAAWMHS